MKDLIISPMKLSWSHKLFLKINKSVGKRPWLDKIMFFFGQWLIFGIAFATAILFFTSLETRQYFLGFIFSLLVFGVAYGISYTIAILFKHPRPIRELPNVKELIIPIETWKSFPSDHTIAVTLFTLISFYATLSFEIMGMMALAAVLVMIGRVYCGVHYPRDILGGIVVAFFSTILVISGFLFYVFLTVGNPTLMN